MDYISPLAHYIIISLFIVQFLKFFAGKYFYENS
jgi:hypothetical protein